MPVLSFGTETSTSCTKISARSGWNFTTAQEAKLEPANATAKAYPHWHQIGFTERIRSP